MKQRKQRNLKNQKRIASGVFCLFLLQILPISPSHSQDSSAKSLRPGQRLIERRRMRRLLRQQQNAQSSSDRGSQTRSLDTKRENKKDHSIEIITPEDLEKSEVKSGQESERDAEKRAEPEKAGREEAEKAKNNEKSAGETWKEWGEAPCLSWLNPLGKPKAVILCVHGLGLHSGSYEKFGKAMSARGYAVYAVDVRGFGSWMEAKGREKCDFKNCSDDIVATLKVLRMANPGVPIFLLGESMGGAIALDVAADNQALMNGLISAVPAAERFKTGRTDLKVFLRLVTGNRKVNVEKSVVNQATADPALREEWSEDPLGKMNLSAGELVQFQVFMNDNHERARKIDRLPVLLVQGGKDKLVKPEGTREIFEELVTQDKIMAMVNGAEHLVYEEGQFTPEVLNLTDEWIVKHLPNRYDSAASADLIRARQMMQQRQFAGAIPLLQRITAAEPENPEPFVMLGLAYMKTSRPLKARASVRQAFMIARASKDPAKSRKANDLLLNLPVEIVSPVLARQAGSPRGMRASEPMSGTYKVLIFTAKWCEPCKELNPIIQEAKNRFGNKVEFSLIDVDDESSHSLVEKYHVSPIPTMIFLRPNGEVADYSVGFSGVSGMIKGIAKMLLPG